MKRCVKCRDIKPIDAFPHDRRRRDGRFPYCKECHCENQARFRAKPGRAEAIRQYQGNRYRAWRQADPEGTAALIRARAQLRRYGLLPEDYLVMLNAQGGECALAHCHRKPEDELHGRLHVDHCHATGEIRGLLCFSHNAMLGQAQDRAELLRDAVEYLAKPPARGLVGAEPSATDVAKLEAPQSETPNLFSLLQTPAV